MKQASKQNDLVIATDTHIVMVSTPTGPVPTPMTMPFSGPISAGLSGDVLIEDLPAALDGAQASNSAVHVPVGGTFQRAPSNKGVVQARGGSVYINGKLAARADDQVVTCNDPSDAPNGKLVSQSTVWIGD